MGNLPFRRICKELGADVTCSEMATCTGLLQGTQSEWALLKRHYTEDLFGVQVRNTILLCADDSKMTSRFWLVLAQVCGSRPDVMTRCAQMLCEQTDTNFIDVNLGCPIELFFKQVLPFFSTSPIFTHHNYSLSRVVFLAIGRRVRTDGPTCARGCACAEHAQCNGKCAAHTEDANRCLRRQTCCTQTHYKTQRPWTLFNHCKMLTT